MDKWFNVGKIVNTHGIRGEVRVISRTDFPEERYAPGSQLYLFKENSEPVELTVETHRIHKSFHLLKFKNYNTIEDVESMKGAILKIHDEQLTNLEENEFYFHEIIGCSVFTTKGEEIGEIREILTPGANDVWVVKGKGGKEFLIPYIEQVVKKIDIKEKIVLIEPMEGLLS